MSADFQDLIFSFYGIAMLILLVIIIAGIFFAFSGVRQYNISRRLEKITGTRRFAGTEEEISLIRRERKGETYIATLLPSLQATSTKLRRTGLPINLVHYALGVMLATLLLSFILPMPNLPSWSSVFAYLFIIHFTFQWLVLPFLVNRRRNKILRQLPDAMDFIVRSLLAGRSIEQAMTDALPSMESPLSDEFKEIPALMEMGMTLADAMTTVAVEMDMPEFDFFVSACIAQVESGGSLAEVLRSLSETIRSRHQLHMKIDAMSAEGKMSVLVLAALPMGLLLYLTFLQPGYVMPLYETELGIYIFWGAIVFTAMGSFVAHRLTKIKV